MIEISSGSNDSKINWDNTETILEKGMDYLKNNLQMMDRYYNIWEEAKQTGQNSEAARTAGFAVRGAAVQLNYECEKLLDRIKPRLLRSCEIDASSPETEKLAKIDSTAKIAKEYFKSVLDNSKLPGSLTAITFFGAAATIILTPIAILIDVEMSHRAGIFQGVRTAAVAALVVAIAVLSRQNDNINERKMYAMRNLFEKALY